jgi:hypothetical protein
VPWCHEGSATPSRSHGAKQEPWHQAGTIAPNRW